MKRFYYLTSSLASVKGITAELQQAGIGENHLHVVGQNPSTVLEAHVHAATPLEETDIMHSGFMGALIGMVVGLLVGFLLAGDDPWGLQLDGNTIIATTIFGACFGAWLGGIRGISSRNHHLQPYMSRVEQGDYLMMVDVDDDRQEGKVTSVMRGHSNEAEEVGHEDHYSPFD